MKASDGSLKLVILGAKGSGKSAITVRYLTKRYIGEYRSGSDIEYNTEVNIGEDTVKVEILDTSDSQDRLTESTLRRCHADAYVIVYSIDYAFAFTDVQLELEMVRKHHPSSRIPVSIIGNKTDLEHLRKVAVGEICSLAQKFNCSQTELSAAEDIGELCAVFNNLLSTALEVQKQTTKNIKRRKNILGHVSKKLGNMFKRKSLEDLIFKRRHSSLQDKSRRSL